MNTRTEPHLDVEQLLGGEPLGAEDRDHLANCAGCRSELACWDKVSSGAQRLVAATELPPWQFPAARTSHRPSRRALITTAAAAAVLAAGGTAWGVISSQPGAPAVKAGLTAVTGCPGLAATSGQLKQINGTTLVVQTRDGHDVTVTTGSATAVRAEVAGSVSDIADGTQALVHGTADGSTLAAQNVIVNLGAVLPQAPRAKGPAPRRLATAPPTANPGPGIAKGVVSDVHAGAFTVTQPLGRRVQVTTSAATVVDMMVSSSVGRLETGVQVIVVGHSEPDGTLAASTVEQGATLPQIQTPPSRSATGTCDPSTVASALAFGG
jgi:uncharacterized protein DUF5666